MFKLFKTALMVAGMFFILGAFVPSSHNSAFTLGGIGVSYMFVVCAVVAAMGMGWLSVGKGK